MTKYRGRRRGKDKAFLAFAPHGTGPWAKQKPWVKPRAKYDLVLCRAYCGYSTFVPSVRSRPRMRILDCGGRELATIRDKVEVGYSVEEISESHRCRA